MVSDTPWPANVSPGDLVEGHGTSWKKIGANKNDGLTPLTDRVLDPRRLKNMAMRSAVETHIRNFFLEQGFLETRTPQLVRSPGMEPHVHPYQLTTGEFLPTSPEFAMKKLLVGGLENIFQICSSFRYEPHSNLHSPEFTILEWYRAYASYETIMVDFENLVESAAIKLFGKPELTYQGKTLSVKTPWPRFSVRDLFSKYAGLDLAQAKEKSDLIKECKRLEIETSNSDSWDDLFFKIWLNKIEPKLPKDAFFVTLYPESQAALSVTTQDAEGNVWAKRFEPYIGGLEIGNAFEELTDPVEQKKRFLKDQEERQKVYGNKVPQSPIDDEFIVALKEGMPPSAGIAVGVDRLVMLFADEKSIDMTLWLPPYSHR